MALKDGVRNGLCDTNINDELERDETTKSTHVTEFENALDFLSHVLQKVDQAFYVCDVTDVLLKIQNWRKFIPNVQPFYAVKANSDPGILKLMVSMGLSFDCASENEIKMVLKAGGKACNIVFAHTYKPISGLKYASKVGVDLMTFDSEDELFKIHKHFSQARLLLRICAVDVSASFDLSKKYGCGFEETCELLEKAKELRANIVGVSFHVGSLCSNSISYVSTIKESRRVFDFASQLGFHFTILDIGGGFYGDKGSELIFQKTCNAINEALEKYFPDDRIEVIAEPGCYFVCSAFSLVTKIIGKKVFKNSPRNDGIQVFYYLNEGTYGSFSKGIDKYNIRLRLLLKSTDHRTVYKSKLWGQSLDIEDVIRKQCELPDMKVGERIVWDNMGAYSRTLCTSFNGAPLPFTKYYLRNCPELEMEKLPNKLKKFLDHIEIYVKNGKF